MKLQKDEIRPVRKRARSAGRTLIAQTWSNAKEVTALRYFCKADKELSLRQFR
jgi:hypothetical protein